MATIPGYLHRILIIEGSGSESMQSLFNVISHQPNIDKMNLYANDPYEWKYQFLINKRERTGLKHLHLTDSKAFIEYSNDMDNTYKNVEEYKQNRKLKY